MLCYVVSYLDRINVGFAKLQMLGDLGFSETVFGLGAGIFFIGYFFFEVPSNIIMHRVGARIWIARIMITWGLVSAATLLVKTPTGVLWRAVFAGTGGGGIFPGDHPIPDLLVSGAPARQDGCNISCWRYRCRELLAARFPGFIMQFLAGKSGWPGWKWLFLLEAVPAMADGRLRPSSISTAEFGAPNG